jgi:hypothetical protein
VLKHDYPPTETHFLTLSDSRHQKEVFPFPHVPFFLPSSLIILFLFHSLLFLQVSCTFPSPLPPLHPFFTSLSNLLSYFLLLFLPPPPFLTASTAHSGSEEVQYYTRHILIPESSLSVGSLSTSSNVTLLQSCLTSYEEVFIISNSEQKDKQDGRASRVGHRGRVLTEGEVLSRSLCAFILSLCCPVCS